MIYHQHVLRSLKMYKSDFSSLPFDPHFQGRDAVVAGFDRGAEEGEVCQLDAQVEQLK